MLKKQTVYQQILALLGLEVFRVILLFILGLIHAK